MSVLELISQTYQFVIDDFKEEIKLKLNQDLENLINKKSKDSVLESLLEAHSFEIPQVMIDSEVKNMRLDAANRVGLDLKDLKDEFFR